MTTTTSRRYRIVVRGRVTERFAGGFTDLTVQEGDGRTTLVGSFADPSALYGLLAVLHDLRIELVSVDAAD
jgi:hypothetical protein